MLRGERRSHLSAVEVFAATPDGTDADVADAAQLFFGVVGQVAGENYVIGLWSGSILQDALILEHLVAIIGR